MCDTDRDGSYELIFSTYGGSYTIYFYELHLPGTWDIDSAFNLNQPLLWDNGDFDADGLHDLVMQCGGLSPYWVGISIFESPDSFSYPTEEVWRDTVDIGTVQPICAYDIDKNGISEILQTGGEAGTNYYIDFSIYESISNNAYAVKYSFESPETPTSTVAFGDFDTDNLIEFVLGTIDGQYSIFESPANDSYVPVFVNVQLPTANIKDCFSVPDADGDGKQEFVVKGFTVTNARIHAYIFEETGNNTYEIIKSFDLSGGYNLYGGGYSEASDVDGDSIPEIVLEACQSVYIIKSTGNDSFYVWETLPGNLSGSSIRITDDLDNNGLNEIVVSGNNQTKIYEYEPEGITEEATFVQKVRLEVFPNPFREKITVSWQINDGAWLKASDKVDLKIYNAAGQLVRYQILPDNNSLQSTIIWCSDDNTGREVPPGVYFIHLSVDKYSTIKKVTLLR